MTMSTIRNSLRNSIVVAAAFTALLAGCGATRTTSRAPSASPSATNFVLSEWAITAPTSGLRSGATEIIVTNRGSETHELVIVRATDPASLELKSNGAVDEDTIAEADKVGEIADIAVGATERKRFDLPAGDYVALCNLVDQMGMGNGGMGNGSMGNGSGMGHVHFRLGMVTKFTVT